MHSSPLVSTLGAFINLEAMGAGGLPIVFQHTGAWTVEAYARCVMGEGAEPQRDGNRVCPLSSSKQKLGPLRLRGSWLTPVPPLPPPPLQGCAPCPRLACGPGCIRPQRAARRQRLPHVQVGDRIHQIR